MSIPNHGQRATTAITRARSRRGPPCYTTPMARPYRTTPEDSAEMPSGITFIMGNEVAERFSFYGMKAILFTFMTTHLVDAAGAPAAMTDAEAKTWIHTFVAFLYATPLLGGVLADAFFGKYRVIIGLSLVYCVGHAILAVDHTATGLALGLAVIGIGAGGIKPCVSAHVGDQFGPRNAHRLGSTFAFFYMSINIGAFTSMMLTPKLMEEYGPDVGFGVPGVLMLVATAVFWMGRHRFAHIPPSGIGFMRDLAAPEGRRMVGRLAVLYVFVALFFSLFDQTASSWVQQGKRMELHGEPWLADAMQSANPMFVLLLTPLFALVVYPRMERVVRLSPLRKIGAGMVLAGLAFCWSAGLETALDAGAKPTIFAQLVGYLLLTAGELLVSVTALEYAYTQAPPRIKSFVMTFYLGSVAIGNLITVGITKLTADASGQATISSRDAFLLYAGIIAAGVVAFIPYARLAREQSYLPSSEPDADAT